MGTGAKGQRCRWHEFEDNQCDRLLPSDAVLEKIMRYEVHLNRLFHRDLHAFQRLIAARADSLIAPSLAVDVDVSAGLMPSDSTKEMVDFAKQSHSGVAKGPSPRGEVAPGLDDLERDAECQTKEGDAA